MRHLLQYLSLIKAFEIFIKQLDVWNKKTDENVNPLARYWDLKDSIELHMHLLAFIGQLVIFNSGAKFKKSILL